VQTYISAKCGEANRFIKLKSQRYTSQHACEIKQLCLLGKHFKNQRRHVDLTVLKKNKCVEAFRVSLESETERMQEYAMHDDCFAYERPQIMHSMTTGVSKTIDNGMKIISCARNLL
jgi:hypothetical protein